MLLRLPDECRQQVWTFFGFRELCRVSCVARGATLGVDARRLWRRRALELLRDEQAQMRAHTGLLGHRLQRGFASRDLLSTGDAPSVLVDGFLREDRADDGFDWRRWYRETYLVRAPFLAMCVASKLTKLSHQLYRAQSLTVFTAANVGFTEGVNELQELKAERTALKEALQAAKSSAHADKRARRVQMLCVRWMNRSHRRRSAAASSQQAQRAQLSRVELADELQTVEAAVQARGKELFTLRSRALKSLHKLNKHIAEGVRIVTDVATDVVRDAKLEV